MQWKRKGKYIRSDSAPYATGGRGGSRNSGLQTSVTEIPSCAKGGLPETAWANSWTHTSTELSETLSTNITAGTAEQRYDLLGKEKLWYILSAGKGAALHVGFRRNTDASEFYDSCLNGKQDSLLTGISPEAGQSFLIPAGTPHCTDGELEILEIAESSPLDFCLHPRGTAISEDQFDPALTFTDALDFISYGKFAPRAEKEGSLAEIPQFCVRKLSLDTPLVFQGHGDSDSFVLFCCIGGKAEIQVPDPSGTPGRHTIGRTDCVLVPAECRDFNIVPMERGTMLLEITNSRVEPDRYIDPNVPATLPE